MNFFGRNLIDDGKLIYRMGHNDADGNVFCECCKWRQHCTSLEQAEFRLAKHLLTEHGVLVTHKQVYLGKDLVVTDVPPIDDPE